MKAIYVRYNHQLLHIAVTLALLAIVFIISSGIFADVNYYKALFGKYVRNSHDRVHKVVKQN